MDQDQIDTMVQLGIQDGIASVQGGADEAANTAHFFALKNSHDKRVSGKNYDEFIEMKKNGEFGEGYNLLKDEQMAALFLQ